MNLHITNQYQGTELLLLVNILATPVLSMGVTIKGPLLRMFCTHENSVTFKSNKSCKIHP